MKRAAPALSPLSSTALSPAVAEAGPLTELAIPFGAWLKYPHVRNILNIYKDISKNALGMFCCCCRRVQPPSLPSSYPPLSASVSRHSLFVECFAHFLVERPKGKFNFKLRHEGCPVAGNEGEEWGGGTVNGLRHLSACVLLGKCQKPLVKKPYGNYSTQLNMKCGKGSAVSPGMRFGGGTGGSEEEGCRMKKVAALGK